jgi:hypothetical protein
LYTYIAIGRRLGARWHFLAFLASFMISKATCLWTKFSDGWASHFQFTAKREQKHGTSRWAHCSTRRNKQQAPYYSHLPFLWSTLLIIDCLSCFSKRKESSVSMVRTSSIATLNLNRRRPRGVSAEVPFTLLFNSWLDECHHLSLLIEYLYLTLYQHSCLKRFLLAVSLDTAAIDVLDSWFTRLDFMQYISPFLLHLPI